MVNKYNSRKWKITKTIFWISNIIGISILIATYFLGAKAFMEALVPVLAFLGAVNTVTAGAYNYSNAIAKQFENNN